MKGVKTSFNEAFFDEVGPSQAWLLGLLAADGCIVKDRHCHLGQSGDDGLEIIEKVVSLLDYAAPIGHSLTSRKTSHRLWFTSKYVVQQLGEFNIVPRKSLTYTFPEALPLEVLPQFVAGYIDGDGSVGVYNRGRHETLSITLVGTEAFTSRLNELLPIAGHRYMIKSARNAVSVTWYGSKAVELGHWMWGEPLVIASRKFRVFRDWADTRGNAILQRKQRRVCLPSNSI